MSEPESLRGRVPGELWMVGVIFGYTASYLFDKSAVAGVDPLLGPAVRNLPSLVLGLVLVTAGGAWSQLRPSSADFVGRTTVQTFVASGFISPSGTLAFYFAVLFGGLVVTVPITQLVVVWGAVIGWIHLGERVSVPARIGILATAVGLAMVAYGQNSGSPVSDRWMLAIPLALYSSVAWAIAGALWRSGQLRGASQPVAITIQFGVAVLFMGAVAATAAVAGWMGPATARGVGALLASGLLSGVIGIYCLFWALRVLPVARVYTLNSITPIATALLGHFVFGEYLDGLMLAGVALTSVGVALVQFVKPAPERGGIVSPEET